jgi:5-oxoprolinase (ATP-hydrolysing) subunit A
MSPSSALDINCDLGEGEPFARTAALLRHVTSANIACGGHAGTARTIDQTIRLALQNRVLIGAHPGPWNRDDFGRGKVRLDTAALEMLLLHQIGALKTAAEKHGAQLHHIKLHGALYHATEFNPAFARTFLLAVSRWWPGTIVYALAGGTVARLGRKLDVTVWEEAFADRNYEDATHLVSRESAHALLQPGTEFTNRIRSLVSQQQIITLSGKKFAIKPRTICIHSDTTSAVAMARELRNCAGC